MKALVGTFSKEKALVGTFSVIVKFCEDLFTAPDKTQYDKHDT